MQPGDTLPAVAKHFGTDTDALVHLNGLRSPRELYPGQRLRLFPSGHLDTSAWVPYRLTPGEAFSLLARRAALPWELLCVLIVAVGSDTGIDMSEASVGGQAIHAG